MRIVVFGLGALGRDARGWAVVGKRAGSARVALDLLRAQRGGTCGLARRQQARLVTLVRYARARSRYPTPPGEPSHTVLLTNLANRVQPIIRYDLGDTVTARPDPCPCGSPLPAIRVQGRRDDVLRLQATSGRTISVPPLAIGSVLDQASGVYRSQLVQTGPASVLVRLALKPGAHAGQAWDSACRNLAGYLAAQGLAGVEIIRAAEPPETSATSGKFRQVIAGSRAGSR